MNVNHHHPGSHTKPFRSDNQEYTANQLKNQCNLIVAWIQILQDSNFGAGFIFSCYRPEIRAECKIYVTLL